MRAIAASKPSRSRSKRPTRSIGLPDGCGDEAVDVVGKARLLSMHEVEDELPVPLRAGQARVYDPRRRTSPRERGLDDLAYDAPVHVRVSNDALRSLGATGFELRLDENERLPAGRGKPEHRRQRELHADERDVARDELRRER